MLNEYLYLICFVKLKKKKQKKKTAVRQRELPIDPAFLACIQWAFDCVFSSVITEYNPHAIKKILGHWSRCLLVFSLFCSSHSIKIAGLQV